MSFSQSFLNETDVIWEKGYNIVRLCKLAGIDRKTLWRARRNPDEITINTADKIIRAVKKFPHLPFEFKKNPYGD